jgi:hypothetical protein
VRFCNLLYVCTVLTTDTVTGTAPWVTRVNHIKAATAVNHEAEHKLTRVNEEMQSLARSLRVKDQSIQETGVKIELMERRLEASRKQADMISELEGEISKARKQESAYEEAMEQLQSDLDTLEKENAKLKASVAANPERQGKLRLFLRFFFTSLGQLLCEVSCTFQQKLRDRKWKLLLSKAVWRHHISSNRYMNSQSRIHQF